MRDNPLGIGVASLILFLKALSYWFVYGNEHLGDFSTIQKKEKCILVSDFAQWLDVIKACKEDAIVNN